METDGDVVMGEPIKEETRSWWDRNLDHVVLAGGRRDNPQLFSPFLQSASSRQQLFVVDWHLMFFFPNLSFQAYDLVVCWGSVSPADELLEEDAVELRINYVKHKVKKDQDLELDHAAWEQVPRGMRVSRRIDGEHQK